MFIDGDEARSGKAGDVLKLKLRSADVPEVALTCRTLVVEDRYCSGYCHCERTACAGALADLTARHSAD